MCQSVDLIQVEGKESAAQLRKFSAFLPSIADFLTFQKSCCGRHHTMANDSLSKGGYIANDERQIIIQNVECND